MARIPAPGTSLTVVKLRPDGHPAARYPGVCLPGHPGWVVIEARWTYREVASGPLTFAPGDRLVEFFSVVEPVSAFAVFAPEGRLKGWYANVSCPVEIDGDEVRWRDLYLDVVVTPGREPVVLDEDELETAGLATADPEGYACVLAARDRLLAMIRAREYPFSEAW